MKWFRRIVIVLITLLGGLVSYALLTALRTERPVGFQITRATDTDGHPFALGVWYPTQSRPWPTTLLGTMLMNVARNAPISGQDLPLVVISHGNGGGPASHVDLALALANAGYVVAAPMHSGDNYADQSAFGSVSWLVRRTSEVHATIDYMLDQWQGHDHINAERIGAFGFSAGGFTVLTAIGAQPDLRIIASHCAELPEFVCNLLSQVKSPLLNADTPTLGAAFLPDARIKAAVVAAPGFGFTLVPHGLDPIRVPIQLWGADDDRNVPYATNTKLVHEALSSRVEFHSVANAGHFSFLTPCGLLAPPELCSDQEGFDRKAFHMEMNASVIAFFEKNMKAENLTTEPEQATLPSALSDTFFAVQNETNK
ncbi:MAG: prolyl oligopeptidase family serine peptidase [Caldilineaceae bacterium]